MLGDLAGTAPLHKALLTTNELLGQVLEELRTTNGRQLETVAAELRTINAALDGLVRSEGGRTQEPATGGRTPAS